MSLIEIGNFIILLICGFFIGRYFYTNYGVWQGILGFFGGFLLAFLVLNILAYFLKRYHVSNKANKEKN